MSLPAAHPRRWFQFTLRGLLLLIVLAALGALVYRSAIEPYRRQFEAMQAIADLKGTVHTSPAAAWQRWLLGDDFLNVVLVSLPDCDEPEKFLPLVADLPCLEVLVVGGLSFQDQHIERLHGLRSLRWLVLDSADVSPGAISALKTALPQVEVYRSQRRAVAGLRKRPGAVFLKQTTLDRPELASRIDAEHHPRMIEGDVALAWNGTDADLQAGLPWLKCLDTLEELSLKGRIKDE